MKTPDKILSEMLGHYYLHNWNEIENIIRSAQIEAYNEAIDDVLELSYCNTIPRNDIIDLKIIDLNT